jgi:putative sterol carrier protein
MYDFLSDEWMTAAREIREKYHGDIPEVTIEVRINQIITDVPFGDGTISAYIDTSSGSLDLELGELEDPDAVLMVDYATAKAMIVERDPAVVMQSFLEGRIKVQGDMMKIMAMQATAASQDAEVAERVADEIRSITN